MLQFFQGHSTYMNHKWYSLHLNGSWLCVTSFSDILNNVGSKVKPIRSIAKYH